jgi:hypothetical protein
MSRNLGALTLLDPSGPAWPVMGVLYLFLLRGGERSVSQSGCFASAERVFVAH